MLELVAIALLALALAGVISHTAAIIGAAIALVVSVFSSAAGFVRLRQLAGGIAAGPLIGRQAIARTALQPEGVVFIQGERWRATLGEGLANAGDPVEIVGGG